MVFLFLKHVKSVLIISGCILSEELVAAVKQWLCVHIPEFSSFKICTSGKYLGWHLGVDSNELSCREPLAKYGKRVVDISEAEAPATISMLRYNESYSCAFLCFSICHSSS